MIIYEACSCARVSPLRHGRVRDQVPNGVAPCQHCQPQDRVRQAQRYSERLQTTDMFCLFYICLFAPFLT